MSVCHPITLKRLHGFGYQCQSSHIGIIHRLDFILPIIKFRGTRLALCNAPSHANSKL